MSLKSIIGKKWAEIKVRKDLKKAESAFSYQNKWLKTLTFKARNTEFGKHHRFSEIKNHDDFKRNVPVINYEEGKKWFDQTLEGGKDILWPGRPLFLAKTSGTTSGSKFIPITKESIKFHISAARDALFHYIVSSGNHSFIDGKMMFLSGSPVVSPGKEGILIGRLSGIVNHFVPSYLQRNKVPSYTTNCIDDWEEKINTIIQEVCKEDLRLISGIPPWVQMFFENHSKKHNKPALEEWKNLSLYVHGGVDFKPYKGVFDEIFEEKVDYWETFPASEGFFAYQSDLGDPGLLLNIDAGMFYEFIPVKSLYSENPPRLNISEVEVGVPYALIISSNAGLWAYNIGDCVQFVSLSPAKIIVMGRVKQFLSAFGEHVIEEEISRSILGAMEMAGGKIKEYTVAPLILAERGTSKHQWFIEFIDFPPNLEAFIESIDQNLQTQNSYYKDLRQGKMLDKPEVLCLKTGSSREYMSNIGKLGGQNKFPHLQNDRKIASFFIEQKLITRGTE